MVLHDITFAVVHEFQIKGIENIVYSKHYQWLWFSVLNLFTDMIRIPVWIRSLCHTTCCRRFALCFVGPNDSGGWPYKMTPVRSFVRLSFRPFEDIYGQISEKYFLPPQFWYFAYWRASKHVKTWFIHTLHNIMIENSFNSVPREF